MGAVTEQPASFYDEVGGAETFRTIVSRFYQLVREDEILRPLYPEDDLDGAEERLRMFLEQYWGGPRTYSDQRGHPRLRMRHAPFKIGSLERDAWLRCMHTAVAEIDSDDARRRAPPGAAGLPRDGGAVDGQLAVLAQDDGGVTATAVDGAEAGVDAQPRRQYADPHHLVGGHRLGRELIGRLSTAAGNPLPSRRIHIASGCRHSTSPELTATTS